MTNCELSKNTSCGEECLNCALNKVYTQCYGLQNIQINWVCYNKHKICLLQTQTVENTLAAKAN